MVKYERVVEMLVKGIGISSYIDLYTKKKNNNISERDFDEKIFNIKYEENQSEDEKIKTNTEIVVKADGSRVLVITSKMGGSETTMSLQLSEPTDLPTDSHSDILNYKGFFAANKIQNIIAANNLVKNSYR